MAQPFWRAVKTLKAILLFRVNGILLCGRFRWETPLRSQSIGSRVEMAKDFQAVEEQPDSYRDNRHAELKAVF